MFFFLFNSGFRSKQLSSIPPGPILMFRNLSSFILKEHVSWVTTCTCMVHVHVCYANSLNSHTVRTVCMWHYSNIITYTKWCALPIYNNWLISKLFWHLSKALVCQYHLHMYFHTPFVISHVLWISSIDTCMLPRDNFNVHVLRKVTEGNIIYRLTWTVVVLKEHVIENQPKNVTNMNDKLT